MLQRLHQKLGTASFIISIVALVVALGGGAYAASGGLSGKQKKEVEKIAKKYAGKPGAAGVPGTKGDAGTPGGNGTNGSPGVAGTSVTTAAATVAECPSGGVKVMSASPATKVCNGTTGFTETLPSAKTETGTWAAGPYGSGVIATKVPFSFPIPLAETVKVTFVKSGTGPAACPGTHEAPVAEPGNLCVYQSGGFNFEFVEDENPETGETEESGLSGALLLFEITAASAQARGVWAVTAP
jgi:hypothetical protein